MINVNTIDIKHEASVSQRGKSNAKWKRHRQPEKLEGELKMQLLMDYLLSAQSAMTMRNGHRARLGKVTLCGLDKAETGRDSNRRRPGRPRFPHGIIFLGIQLTLTLQFTASIILCIADATRCGRRH